ncbi:MAG: hypothetical protein L0H84_23115, partial [Pseudonocardia sp.]|nr:hypothetical protein [Pseudonocardia sp.]
EHHGARTLGEARGDVVAETAGAVLALVPRLRTRDTTTRGPVGVLMGGALLSCALVTGAVALTG